MGELDTQLDTPTLIIGAGPGGLAVAGRMREAGLPFEILEAAGQVAPAWHGHYDRLRLHTVKELSHLPGLPFPEHYPRYVPRQALVDYYRGYAHHFGIRPRFGQEVVSVRREGGRWCTLTRQGMAVRSDRVVVATGINRVAHRPVFPGEESFAGEILHARGYRNPLPFVGRRVLVVGMGNTGAEIALDLCEAGVEVALSVRGPVNIVPRDVLGRPTQRTAMLLARLPTRMGDRLGVLLRRLTVGDLTRFGIRTPDLPPSAQLRERGSTPVIDVGTVRRIREGRIRIYPGIEGFDPGGVTFRDGRRLEVESVILATGYRHGLQRFVPGLEGFLDRHGNPRAPVGEGPLQGLYFVGFDPYRPGGILGAVFRESAMVVERIAAEAGRVLVPAGGVPAFKASGPSAPPLPGSPPAPGASASAPGRPRSR